jgi:hypothetical protein
LSVLYPSFIGILVSAAAKIPITSVEKFASPGGDQAALFWKCHQRVLFLQEGQDGD